MSEIVGKDEWLRQWGHATLEQLREGAAQYGHKLKAKNKADAVDEAYALYAGSLKPAAAEPPPPAPAQPLAYEARVFGLNRHSRLRAGYSLTRKWQKLDPQPTAEQLEALKADHCLQVRLA